jgi:holliday junction DNA helicase RuvA
MLHHLSGRLIEKNPAYLIVECHGTGYFVHISLNTYSKVSGQEQVKILTHLQISEDAHTLFGFADEEERRLFRLLITVSGIGCNTARMMLSSMSVVEIQSAIIGEQIARLKAIKGIGEKTAQRLVLELKGKLKKDQTHLPASNLKVKEEAMAALLTLGFSRQAVDHTLEQILKTAPGSGVEELIKHALKAL